MSGYALTSVPIPTAPPSPFEHVDFTLGSILSAADLTQQSAYFAERDRWLARELHGYGTVSGLRVTYANDGGGPLLEVSAGDAVSPCGQLIHVGSPQRADLAAWLRVHLNEVAAFSRGNLAAGANDQLTVYVVLSYRACLLTAPPPAQPCRSEDEWTAPSRVLDEFVLELRFEPPANGEAAALRQFLGWLSQVEVSDTGATSLADFETAVRELSVASPGSPPEVITSPPLDLQIPRAQLRAYLRAALRIWIIELRPAARTATAWWPPHEAGSTEAAADGVLLAQLDLPLLRDAGSGEWAIDKAAVAVRQDERPLLAQVALLQEMLFADPTLAATAGVIGGHGAYRVVAAGRMDAGVIGASFNGLAIVAGGVADGRLKLTFNGYQPPQAAFDYVVKLLAANLPGSPDPQPVNVSFEAFESDGFVLRVDAAGTPLPAAQVATLTLMVEVSRVHT